MPFAGAKLALFIGDRLVVIRRDDLAHIPWPDHLDLPGGGREPGETPLMCALRETREELTLEVPRDAVTWGKRFDEDSGAKWFFVGHMPASAEGYIILGDEGQHWQLMSPQRFIAHPKAVPQFQDRVAMYLAGVSGDLYERPPRQVSGGR